LALTGLGFTIKTVSLKTKMKLKNLSLITRCMIFASLFGAAVFSSAAVSALTASSTISSQISSVISLLTTSGTVNVDVTPTAGGAQTIASDTVTVSTSDTAGYTLTIAETNASTDLVSGSDTIPHSSGSQASPATMSVNTWGYRVDGIGGFGAGPTSGQSSASIGSVTFAAVPATASPNTIKTTSGTATNDTTTVWYGVAADTSQPSGTYTNSVTYTATAN
jgi:hypothetical protein